MKQTEIQELFEKIRTLPVTEACVMAADYFRKVDKDEHAAELFKLYHTRKAECTDWEALLELAVALFREYKENNNLLARRFAEVIVKDL